MQDLNTSKYSKKEGLSNNNNNYSLLSKRKILKEDEKTKLFENCQNNNNYNNNHMLSKPKNNFCKSVKSLSARRSNIALFPIIEDDENRSEYNC